MVDQSLEWAIKLNAELRKQHERDQRVIEAAEKLREAIRGIKRHIDNAMPNTVFPLFEEALAEYDKAKQL